MKFKNIVASVEMKKLMEMEGEVTDVEMKQIMEITNRMMQASNIPLAYRIWGPMMAPMTIPYSLINARLTTITMLALCSVSSRVGMDSPLRKLDHKYWKKVAGFISE
jgi:hypothetical protein